MIDRLIAALAERKALPDADPDRYTAVFNNRANINLVLFERSSGRRLLFVKLSDLRDFEAGFRALTRARAVLGDAVPEPVCSLAFDRYRALVTRAYGFVLLAGRPRLGRRAARRVVDGVAGRLAKLHAATREGAIRVDGEHCDGVLRPMAARFCAQWDDDELRDRLERHLDELGRAGLELPSIPQHGDLGLFNTALRDGDPAQVLFIDWDSYGDVHWPCLDAVTFLTAFGRTYGDGQSAAGLAAPMRAAAERYCRAIGLPPGWLSLLVPVSWLYFADLKLDIGVRGGQAVAYRALRRFFDGGERFLPAPSAAVEAPVADRDAQDLRETRRQCSTSV